jgi:hypothetical protein
MPHWLNHAMKGTSFRDLHRYISKGAKSLLVCHRPALEQVHSVMSAPISKLLWGNYLPMQNWAKMVLRSSSLTTLPVISPT